MSINSSIILVKSANAENKQTEGKEDNETTENKQTSATNIVQAESASHENSMQNSDGVERKNGYVIPAGKDLESNTPTKSEQWLPEEGKRSVWGKFVQMFKKYHIKGKLIYLLTVCSIIALAFGVMYENWFIPYFYTATAPLLLLIRLIMYWKNKWQLFMLDFCYFCNVLCFVFIWAVPWQTEVFTVLFGVTNGPLPFATVLYRNSLVFHDLDKLTSVYIHILPQLITFSARWYSDSLSSRWYTDFVDSYDESVGYMFLWLVGIPFIALTFHIFTYIVCVQYIFKPGEEYIDTPRYLARSSNGCTGKVIGCMGPGANRKTCMFGSMSVLYGVLSCMSLPIWYKYFIPNCLYLIVIVMIPIWNGASYYLDYFGPKAMKL